MQKLKQQLDELIERLDNASQFKDDLKNLTSVYPFSEYEYIISHLLAKDKLTYDEYLELRNSYINRNLYLYIFEISAPRGFGDKWARGHLMQLVPAFELPNRKIDPNYSNQYDLILKWKGQIIKIEVNTPQHRTKRHTLGHESFATDRIKGKIYEIFPLCQ